MWDTKKIIVSVMTGLVLSGSAVAVNKYPLQTGEGFTAGEHVLLGDEVKVYLSLDDNGNTGKELHLENGLALTYGDIVSLADFYGTPGEPISSGKTKSDRENLFLIAFSQFSASADAVTEVPQILEITHEEKKLIEDAISHSQNLDEMYKKISEDHNRRYNCVTGGGCGKEMVVI